MALPLGQLSKSELLPLLLPLLALLPPLLPTLLLLKLLLPLLDLVTKSWPSTLDFPIFSRQKVRPPEFSTCPLQKTSKKKSLPSLRDLSRRLRLEILCRKPCSTSRGDP